MTNVSGPEFIWRASFDGSRPFLHVNGKKVQAKSEATQMQSPVSYVDVAVAPGQPVTVIQ
jgi:hypothetical protein